MSTTKVTDALRNVTVVDAAKITTGTIPEARITTLDATKLTGTVADARFPATLPASSGANLTALPAANLTGTVADARFPATLPATSGVNLTALNGSNIGSGTVPTARLGTGTASSSTFLRGDSTYAAAGGGKVLQVVSTNITTRPTTTVTDTSGVGGDLGLNVAITPTNSSSKFLINVSLGCVGGTDGAGSWGIILVRDSTRIGNGADVSSRNGVFMRGTYFIHDGNHGLSAHGTYYNTTTGTGGSEIIFRANGVVQSSGTMIVNYSASNTDTTNPYGSYTSSSITVTEIGA